MEERSLQSVVVEGFMSIRSASVEVRDLNVLVGANGAGKSNFIRILGMLGRIVDGELGLFVGLSGGASALLYGGAGVSMRIRLEVQSAVGRYSAVLVPAAGDALIFESESVWPKPPVLASYELHGHRESLLSIQSPEPLIADAARPLIEVLSGCRVYHFHDTSLNAPVKQQGYISDNRRLHPDARNLAAVLLRLRERDRVSYARIVATIKQIAPFFRDFVLEPEIAEDRVRLRWRQEGSDIVFPSDALSDGTLRFICLAVLLGQPELPGLIVLDEPELGLHPFAIVHLAEMLRTASRDRQVLIATQSVTLMNQFEFDDLIVVERRGGSSVFERPDPVGLRDWLEEYSLGDLWEKNILGGRPQPERS
jgi:predicted ATPase